MHDDLALRGVLPVEYTLVTVRARALFSLRPFLLAVQGSTLPFMLPFCVMTAWSCMSTAGK